MHPAQLDLSQLLEVCEVTRTRRRGPGGQHRNKVETAVVVRHLPTGTVGQASERRSQAENLQVALFRLRVNLAIQLRYSIGEVYAPSALWASRLQRGRLPISAEHDDFPALLAEALDVLQARGMDLGPAASALRCTASQLLRLLSLDNRALIQVNVARSALGKPRLHPR